jgi:hypothetical protein
MFVPALIAALAAVQGIDEIVLPNPTGKHAVGVVTIMWTDKSRIDSLASPVAARTLLGRIWYPGTAAQGTAPAPYAEHLDAAANDWTALHVRVRTHSYADVAFADGVTRAPVVVLAPGRSTATFDYTTLGENLASHGYIVVGVDSPFHSKVVLADGTLAPIRFPSMGPSTYPNGMDSAQAPMNALVSADLRFAFSQLQQLDQSHAILRGHLDLTRVGMFGHSNGGMAGSRACALEATCRAFFSVEGQQTREIRMNGVDKPYGLLYSEQTMSFDTAGVFTEMRLHAKGPFELYRVAGAGHNSVTDLLMVRPTLFTYAIDSRRGVDITHTIIRSFFDRHLRGAAEKPASFPEVRVQHYGRPGA